MLIWGVVVMFAGFGLLSASGWARWLTIVVASLNFVVQLGFVGSYQYTLWALTVIGLNIIVPLRTDRTVGRRQGGAAALTLTSQLLVSRGRPAA